ncbi:MAG: CRISPR-associated protein Cas4 [Bacteroidales bacterium]|jgi:CRISPR-associated exonuclease Cas4|nr:CRISPR-associated protein Cas4 [Bacteroidales bacterium]NCB43362.1 CRISPR-associated protein Cas4 [Clostridia bacterium]MDD2633777.1 CRISPR-associated protein Cas4 [Bacteroidales bacterium]MDD3527196.1 CRISPR-associated protein Cas4 [Bacteroidales bacterium]MDD4178351.1 CRISPR-associated protein Cas4 [Bacteroidales bacterium]
MRVTGTHINYYLICQRKLWLFANQIQMEHTSDLVYEGRLIHETSYGRRSEKYSELEMDGIKLDYYDAKNKVIHEIKKSDKREEAHLWQLKYYLFVLDKNGVQGATGILEYPKLRHREEVMLSSIDRQELHQIIAEVEKIVAADQAPERLMRSRCRNCSYFDFCWSQEESE